MMEQLGCEEWGQKNNWNRVEEDEVGGLRGQREQKQTEEGEERTSSIDHHLSRSHDV